MGYFIIGVIVFVLTDIISIILGHTIGAGPGDIGIVVSAVSILCGVVVVCTMVIVDTIKSINDKDS